METHSAEMEEVLPQNFQKICQIRNFCNTVYCRICNTDFVALNWVMWSFDQQEMISKLITWQLPQKRGVALGCYWYRSQDMQTINHSIPWFNGP